MLGGLPLPQGKILEKKVSWVPANLVCTSFVTADHMSHAKLKDDLPIFRTGDRF